jgi:predicted Zn finger-like uncharacterized protein
MNFLCEKCKQKYHVADEKLAGRAVTRFRCKKCDNVIELHAPSTQSASPDGASAMSPTTAPVTRPATQAVPIARGTARPRPATSTGPAYGAVPARQATMPPTTTARAPSTSAGTSEHGWYAGIRDVPVGPLSRKDLGSRVAAGDVTGETLVWREGLDDWRPLQAIAELNDLMRAAVSATASESARPASRPAASSAASRAASVRPSIDDDDEEATRVSGLDPSLAGIVAKSIRPVTRDATKTDDRSVSERPKQTTPMLSPLSRTAPATRSATPATPSAAASSKPVDKAIERNASKATEPADEQSAVFPPPARAASEISARPAPRSSDEDPPSGPAVVARSERTPVAAPLTPASGAVEKASFQRPSAPDAAPLKSPSMDDFSASLPDDLFPSSPAQTSARPEAPPTSNALLMPPSVPTTDLAPPPVPAPSTSAGRSGSLPLGAWVLMAGVLVAGIGGGVYIGRHNQGPVQPDAPRPLRTEHPVPTPPPALDAAPSVAPSTPDATALSTDTATTTSSRALDVARRFRESGVVDTCWQTVLRQNPSLHGSTVSIELSVDAQGHYTRVAVPDAPDPRLESCLRSRLADLPALAAGEAADARTSVTLAVHP